jgi:hypothetical protein
MIMCVRFNIIITIICIGISLQTRSPDETQTLLWLIIYRTFAYYNEI